MNKTVINVPAGIRYISDWEGFELPEFPHIIDKQVTGCGFTEWAITSNINMIIASPRVILLENKAEQHPGEVFYARNDLDSVLNVDRDLTKALSNIKKTEKEQEKLKKDLDISKKKSELRKQIRDYYLMCLNNEIPCKILVTYDSYRIVFETLMSLGKECFDSFYTIVDEFQSIFIDSKFKSDTELEFISVLKKVNRLCFVSATPMIDEYLDMLDDFKNLPLYELNWGILQPDRIINPQLSIFSTPSITESAIKIIETYKKGKFEKTVVQDMVGNFLEIESKELVIYVNSVKNICDIIKKAALTIDETNVLCSATNENKAKIRKAFGLSKGQPGGIGRVPLKHEPRKMFTLCTRTVYLGADFYSTNARSVILSDANIDCLAVDITLDLPQILGRQRLVENPWKNRAELYIKCLSKKNIISVDDYKKYQEAKITSTKNLLSVYHNAEFSTRHTLAKALQKLAKSYNYKDDYVAVNTHNGSDLVPVFNNLVMISELRAFQIQQIDYVNRFRVLNQIQKDGYSIVEDAMTEFLEKFNSFILFKDKMRLLCEYDFQDNQLDIILSQIPIEYSTYYKVLGPTKIKAHGYQRSKLNAAMSDSISIVNGKLGKLIYNEFKIGDKLSNTEIKERLRKLYKENNIDSTPKATDITSIFKVKKIKITLDTLERVNGLEITELKIKE